MNTLKLFSLTLMLLLTACNSQEGDGVQTPPTPAPQEVEISYTLVLDLKGETQQITFNQGKKIELGPVQYSNRVTLYVTIPSENPNQNTLLANGISPDWAPLEILYLSCHVSISQPHSGEIIYDICKKQVDEIRDGSLSNAMPIFNPDRPLDVKSINFSPEDDKIEELGTAIWNRYRELLKIHISNHIGEATDATLKVLPSLWFQASQEIEEQK